MVGHFRFLLAYLVLLSHINLRMFDINPGVFAVVIFYILAGYVVTRLWDEILPQGPGMVGRFLRDRALRIFPLYGYVCLLTICFLLLTGYGNPDFSPVKLFYNALIMPLNYFMWVNSEILRQPAWCLIPPAWSLGAELQAYLIMLLLFVVRPLKYVLAPASLLLYLIAGFGIINPDYFGYRLVPGVLFIFIIGHCLSRIRSGNASSFDRLYPMVVWLCLLAVGGVLWYRGMHRVPYVRETVSGLLAGIPMVYFLHRNNSVYLPGNSLCGALSYGLFLSHFLVIWLLDYVGFSAMLSGGKGLGYVGAVTVGSVIVAWCGVRYVETPVDRYRKRFG